MKEEFNLSEKRFYVNKGDRIVIDIKDVKEFIRLLKKRIFDARMYADMDEPDFWATSKISESDAMKRADYLEEFSEEIDKLAGDKLVSGESEGKKND